MDDGGAGADSKTLESVGNGNRDEIRVTGIASDNEAEGDHAIGFLTVEDGGHGDGDLERTRHADEVDTCHGDEFTELVDGILDKGISEFFVEFGSDDTDPDLLADDPWLWLQRGGHGVAMEATGKIVN